MTLRTQLDRLTKRLDAGGTCTKCGGRGVAFLYDDGNREAPTPKPCEVCGERPRGMVVFCYGPKSAASEEGG